MRKGLIRKAHLAHNLKKWAAKHPASRLAAATPETHILAVDDVDYIDEALSDLPEVRWQFKLRNFKQRVLWARFCPLTHPDPGSHSIGSSPALLRPCAARLLQVRDMEPGSAVWIMKPSLTNQGAGICIIDSCAGLRAALEAAPDLREWVVQRYVDRPLLVQGRKFHIRAYALCVGEVGAGSPTPDRALSLHKIRSQ